MILIIGVRFRKSGKVYYFDPTNLDIKKNDHVIVETARGVEYGTVVLSPKEVTDDKVIQPLKPVIRIATPEDDAISAENERKEKEAYKVCLEKILKHELEMKLIDSEYTFDRNKLLFYFTADGRIDFRELVKDLAAVFRTRIELRQIGVRDETKMIGGIAICGRPLCCNSYLSDFAPVSIKMAKEQNLSLNPAKISGVCGRLMCCLKNEEDAYEYLNKTLPHIGTHVTTEEGYNGDVQSVSVLKQRVKVVITNDNGEKEVREYPVDELKFETKNRPTNVPIAPIIPDEVIDEKTIKELEKLEKQDLEEISADDDNNTQKRGGKKNYNRQKRQPRENNKDTGRSNYKGNSRDIRKDNSSEHQKENNRNYSKENTSENTRENARNNNNENPNKKRYNKKPYQAQGQKNRKPASDDHKDFSQQKNGNAQNGKSQSQAQKSNSRNNNKNYRNPNNNNHSAANTTKNKNNNLQG